jgi:hypothetical protein
LRGHTILEVETPLLQRHVLEYAKDRYQCGFGGMGDRFDPILPPDLIVSIAC